ncbi:MAG: hypothetical protein ABI234_10615 [Ktedonobacteraceae bacterium]
MGTTQIAATLYQIQQLDLEADRLLAEQQALTSSLQNTPLLNKLLAEQRATKQQLTKGLQVQKEAEWALDDLVRRLKQHEQRLYSGNVTNPKELSTIQQEVQNLRTQQARQEEKVLGMMEAAEAQQEALTRKVSAISEAKQAWEMSNTAGATRVAQMEVQLQALYAKRVEQATKLDATVLKRYEGMRKIKQGRVVSKVEQSSCQCCRVILTASELQRVRISSELQTCSNCGRILYDDR